MQEIEGYIRDHRHRYTREAIVAELEAAGHPRHEIDSAWDRVSAEAPMSGPATGHELGRYVWIVYWIGAGLIVLYTVAAIVSSGTAGFIAFGLGWLLAYLGLAYYPARAMARARPSSGATTVAVVVGAPLVVLLIGGGICLGTIALIAGSFG